MSKVSPSNEKSARSPCVLITRPEPDASDYALELQRAGYQTMVAPMLEIEPLPFALPDFSQYQGLLLTSANAVRILSRRTEARDVPVYCVGKYTADAARDFGCTDIHNVQGTGDDLARFVIEYLDGQKDRPLLHVRGTHAARPIDALLREAGFVCDKLVIYRARKVSDLAPEILSAINGQKIDSVTFFSKRTAESFMALVQHYELEERLHFIKLLCISPGVLECVQTDLWGAAYVSEMPDRKGMYALLQKVSPV